MDDADDGTHVRAPTIEDVGRIGRSLNEAQAHYVLIGGFALIAHGSGRTTKDIDLLVDPSAENVARVKAGLSVLADNAAAEIEEDDIEQYTVVRVADEVLVDLLGQACNVTYEDAIGDAKEVVLAGAPIPVASKETLIRTKARVIQRRRCSRNARDERHWRTTVRELTPKTSAVSSQESPAKKRSSTMRARCSSTRESSSSALFRASTSSDRASVPSRSSSSVTSCRRRLSASCWRALSMSTWRMARAAIAHVSTCHPSRSPPNSVIGNSVACGDARVAKHSQSGYNPSHYGN